MAEIQVQHGVHDERLAVAALEIEHPVMADGGDAAQRDLVHAGLRISWCRRRPGCRAAMRAATLTASRLGPTSCTRTAQAPRKALMAVTAAVAASRSTGWPLAGDGQEAAEEALAGAGHEDLVPHGLQHVQPLQQFPVLRLVLREAQSGSTMICSGATPAA